MTTDTMERTDVDRLPPSEHQVPPEKLRPAGVEEMANGTLLWPDGAGGFTPEDRIKTQLKIEDEMVRKMLFFAEQLSGELARFKARCFTDIADFQGLLDQHYGGKKGGQKGNVNFTTYDGLLQVTVRVNDRVTFGPEIRTAQSLIEEYLDDLTKDASSDLKALVSHAFKQNNEGELNSRELDRLRTYDIKDPRWLSAMEAIADARRSIGKKEYVLFKWRPNTEARFNGISLDFASL